MGVALQLSRGTEIGVQTLALPAPARHNKLFETFNPGAYNWDRCVQGFVTDTEKFVTREQAMVIAKAAGQIKPGRKVTSKLYSEDVW